MRGLRRAGLVALAGLTLLLISIISLPHGLSGSFAAFRARLESTSISGLLGERTGLAAAPVAAAPLPALDTLPITGATYTVNTTNDVDDTVCNAAHCSLREAINASNAASDRDLIAFSIPGAPADIPAGSTTARHQITVASALPTITGPVVIDGATEPDFTGIPVVAIDGGGITANGLYITAGPSAVQYLQIYDFDGDGIRLDTSGEDLILTSYIGVDYNLVGTSVVSNPLLGNSGDGVRITGTMSNTVAGNTIGNNAGVGVRIAGAAASGNLVKGNYIGTSQVDGARLGNGGSGILIDGAPDNSVETNFVHGNGDHGIEVSGAGATGNQLKLNIIGSNVPSGTPGFGNDLPNFDDGIHIDGVPDNALLENRIGQNGGDGIEITGAGATGNALYGNQIGTDSIVGGQDFGNAGDGVRISGGASDNCIGGDSGYALCPGDPAVSDPTNFIAFNGGNGVNVVSGTGNAIRFNAIYTNDGIGIDLGDDGATPNDAGDGDTGANNLQNFPVITSVVAECSASLLTQIVTTLDSPAGTYDIDVYTNAVGSFVSADGPEAQTHIGAATTSPGTTTISLPPGATTNLSITATDAGGNTSEIGFNLGALLTVNDSTDPKQDSYAFVDSNNPGGPTFAFADISGTGTNIGAGDDSRHGPFALGFSFDYFGTAVSDLWIASNGWLSMGAADPGTDAPTNQCPLPDVAAPNSTIAAVWDDLDASVSGAAVFRQAFGASTCPYGGYAGACFIAQWNDVVHQGTSDDLTFQVILFDDDRFLIQIDDASTEIGSQSTTGAENSGGTVGVNYGCDTSGAIEDDLAILFTPAQLGDAAAGDGLCETVVGNGICTLRAAIDESNSLSSFDTIEFNIVPGGPATILPMMTYTATDPVIIDATTQPDLGLIAGRIILDGGGTVDDALRITGGNSIVFGLEIVSFAEDGIELLDQGCNQIISGTIGTDPNATAGLGLGGTGIRIVDTLSNTLRSNNIAGNTGWGVTITGTLAMSNTLSRNFIGVVGTFDDPDAIDPLGNGAGGVLIENASGNFISGLQTSTSLANVISSNGNSGVVITGSLATGNQILHNFIGTDLDGEDALGNTDDGVRIINAPMNTLTGNIIGDNGGRGVAITGTLATGNTLVGNTIGLTASGTMALGNGDSGVFIEDAMSNIVVGNQISGNAGQGVEIEGASAMSTTIASNAIGVNRLGQAAIPNEGSGIQITDASKTTITNNTISGNGDAVGPDGFGIHIMGASATGTLITGNKIGIDLLGQTAIPNLRSGILVDGVAMTTIGGTGGAGNVISGNGDAGFAADGYGIELRGAGATLNVIQGNRIGTNVLQTGTVPNLASGVYLSGAPSNTIGGTAGGTGNVISGNTEHGVLIDGAGATGNTLQGNRIGTNAAGTATNLGNGGSGVYIDGTASSNSVGGTTGITAGGPCTGACNIIAENDDDGVTVHTGITNSILGNSIFDNDALGIDLADDGVTANDGAGDADTGANNLQNFPVLTLAQSLGAPFPAQTMISGDMPSSPGPFRIEFFYQATCDASGNGEGKTFLGALDPAAAGAFMTMFNIQVPVGQFITATATDSSGNTSEFSECLAVTLKPTPTPTNTPTRTPTRTPTATKTPSATFTPNPCQMPKGCTSTPVPTNPIGRFVFFSPVHDARVDSGNPNSNYGSSSYLRLRDDANDFTSYLKFNVSGIVGEVEQVILRLYAYDGGPDAGDVYLVSNNYNGTSTPWVESGLKWNNAPPITGAILDGVGAVSNNTWVEFDVTAVVTGNGTYSFGIKNASTDSIYFRSKEASSNKPQLKIYYDVHTATPTRTRTVTPTRTPTVTQTPTRTRTPTITPTSAGPPTATATPTATLPPTVTPTTGPSPTSTLSPTPTHTSAVTATPQTITLNPVHDARVKSDSPTNNYGTSDYLRVRSTGPAYTSYLKFDVSGLSGTVQQATLRLYTYDGGDDGGAVHSVSNNYADNSGPWTETGLTWNNAPAIGGTALDSAGSVADNTWVEWDVTAAVTGNGTFNFGLKNTSTNSVYFYSREAASLRPQLVVQTQ